jgi:uncharacterized membrane protein (DUF485 family)
MNKVLLMSIVLATFVLPLMTARDPSPARGLRRAVVGMGVIVVCYVVGIVYILPRLQ